MLVRVARFGKRRTNKLFDLETEKDKFKAYMKNQKIFEKSFLLFRSHSTHYVIIHAEHIKEDKINWRLVFGKGEPIGIEEIDSPILLGY